MGRLTPEKGVHFPLEAFNRIDTPLKLVVAGGTPSPTTSWSR